MNTLKNLFLEELADRYDAEKRLVRAIPKMTKAATCAHLQKFMRSHLKETVRHVKKLERIFKTFGATVRTKKCEATIGLLKEGDELAADFKGSPAINAALISIAQKIEHYGIASYGCLREWAAPLENKDATAFLQEILEEEKVANATLIDLARTRSNHEALGPCCVAECDGSGTNGKSMNGRRGLRPLNFNQPRPVLV